MDGDQPTYSVAGIVGALAFGVGILLAVAEIALRIFMPSWSDFSSERFLQGTDVPGYGRVNIGAPGFVGRFAQNNGDFDVALNINAFGQRNAEPVEAANGRLWAIGDSMTFGWGVEVDQAFGAVLGKLLGQPAYNMASPGTGPCGYQALVQRMPADLRPSGVVVGLVLENDINADQCGARPAADPSPNPLKASENSALYLAKEYLTAESALYNVVVTGAKRLGVVESLLTQWGLVRPPHAKHFWQDDISTAAVEATGDKIAALQAMFPADTPFVVLIVPTRFEIRNGDGNDEALRTRIRAALKQRNVPFVDPIEAIKAMGFDTAHFAHDGHWTASAHSAAAGSLAEWFRSHH